MTALIHMGKLQWSAKRKYVEIAPPEKHPAWLARIDQKVSGLPKPLTRTWFTSPRICAGARPGSHLTVQSALGRIPADALLWNRRLIHSCLYPEL
jgi:hypothetical protein